MPKRLSPRGEAAQPVEPVITGATLPPRPAKKRAAPARAPKVTAGAKYVYNLRAIECRMTLTTGRRIELKPRGQRGDLDIVNADEQEDPIFLLNHGLLFQVIEVEDARAIIANQTTNARDESHSIWSHLRNEKGEPYKQTQVTMEEVFEQQGVVVAKIEETGAGRFTDRNFEVRPAGPQIQAMPGSPGHPATQYMTSVPSDVEPGEYHEFLLWKQFQAERAKAAEAATEIQEGDDGSTEA